MSQLFHEIPEKKVCTRCKIEKQKDEFRIGVKEKSGCQYFLSQYCRKCESELARIYYDKKKDDPEFKKKNSERTKLYAQKNVDEIRKRRKLPDFKKKHANRENKRYHRNKDWIADKMKKKRQTPEYKQNRKNYIEKNKEKIAKQEIITKRKYHEKNRDALTDVYIINLLRNQGTVNPTAEQIELKRAKILIKRIKEKVGSSKTGKTKQCSICKNTLDLCEFWKNKKSPDKKAPFCKYCGKQKNDQNKLKYERHNKPAQPPI